MIYVIEDDRSVRRSYERFFESEGLEFTSFESAESFFSGVLPAETDLLLLDINLPAMNGMDLLRLLTRRNQHTPVIVITSNEDAQIRDSCKKYGVKAFLRKPADGAALIDLIKFHKP